MADGVSVEIYSIGGGLKGKMCDAIYETLHTEFGVEAAQVRRVSSAALRLFVPSGRGEVPQSGSR